MCSLVRCRRNVPLKLRKGGSVGRGLKSTLRVTCTEGDSSVDNVTLLGELSRDMLLGTEPLAHLEM